MKIKPAKGMLAVRFEDLSTIDPSTGGVPAKVEAVGRKSDYEEGARILVKNIPWLWTLLGDGSYLIYEDICVLGELDSN